MAYSPSEDKRINGLSYVIQRYLADKNVTFVLQEQDIFAQEVGWHLGVLPLFLMKAKKTYDELFANKEYVIPGFENKKFPIEFFENSDAFFNVEPKLSPNSQNDGAFILINHFCHYAITEYLNWYKKNEIAIIDGKIPLDPLFDEWINSIETGYIKIKRPEAPKKADSMT